MNSRQPFLLMTAAIFMAGCGKSGSDANGPSGPSVTIVYQSSPLANVQVRLHASLTGPVIAQSVSSADGTAYFRNPPSPEPNQYYVSMASLGDGGWILDTKYLKPADSGMKLEPLANNASQRIEIPRGAVRPLGLHNHR